jgi:hypothetical protein
MAKLLTKKFKKKIEAMILPPLLYIIVNILYLTCRKKYHFDKSKISHNPCIFVFWHGELMMGSFAYGDYRNSKNIDTIVSEHGDGEIASRFLSLCGFKTIRGSSSRGGLKALKGAFLSLSQGRDLGITPDGPRGPRHSIASGAAIIAQKKNVPLVAMNTKASRAWRLKSWDRFAIPKPFSRLDFYYSDPFYVTDESVESAKEIIKEKLMKNAF